MTVGTVVTVSIDSRDSCAMLTVSSGDRTVVPFSSGDILIVTIIESLSMEWQRLVLCDDTC